jgi:uncharacterized protein (DUF362 family)
MESIMAMDLIYFSVFKNWLHIVEGLRYCMEGNGPSKGKTILNWGMIAAGLDALELDAVCAEMMGMEASRLPNLKEAARCFGNYDQSILTKIPPHFKRNFKLNDKVIQWLVWERSGNLYYRYLRLAGFLWNK